MTQMNSRVRRIRVRLAQRDSTLNGTPFAHHNHAKIDALLHHAYETNLETTLTAFFDHDILILHVLHVLHPHGLDLLSDQRETRQANVAARGAAGIADFYS